MPSASLMEPPVERQGVGGNTVPVGIDIGGLHDILEVERGTDSPMDVRLPGLCSHLYGELRGARDVDELREPHDNVDALTEAERIADTRRRPVRHILYRGDSVQTSVYLSFRIIRNRLVSQVGVLPRRIAYGAAVEPHRVRGECRFRRRHDRTRPRRGGNRAGFPEPSKDRRSEAGCPPIAPASGRRSPPRGLSKVTRAEIASPLSKVSPFRGRFVILTSDTAGAGSGSSCADTRAPAESVNSKPSVAQMKVRPGVRLGREEGVRVSAKRVMLESPPSYGGITKISRANACSVHSPCGQCGR